MASNYLSVRHHLVEMENKERVEREERVDREEGREDSYIPTGEGSQRSEVQPRWWGPHCGAPAGGSITALPCTAL